MGYKGPCCSINQSTEKDKLSKTVTVFKAEFEKNRAEQVEDYGDK